MIIGSAPVILLRSKLFVFHSKPQFRTFFASSTDHKRLLQEAEVHRLEQDDGSVRMYVMAAGGTDLETVKKVPQLHLARIYFRHDTNTMFGAKVVNRTLGDPLQVCPMLVDAILADVGTGCQALSTLHGLSDWVLRGIEGKEEIEALSKLPESQLDSLTKIAKGRDLEVSYDNGKDSWEQLAAEYVLKGLGAESSLYTSKGATLVGIEHDTDRSDFSSTCAGAMARLSF